MDINKFVRTTIVNDILVEIASDFDNEIFDNYGLNINAVRKYFSEVNLVKEEYESIIENYKNDLNRKIAFLKEKRDKENIEAKKYHSGKPLEGIREITSSLCEDDIIEEKRKFDKFKVKKEKERETKLKELFEKIGTKIKDVQNALNNVQSLTKKIATELGKENPFEKVKGIELKYSFLDNIGDIDKEFVEGKILERKNFVKEREFKSELVAEAIKSLSSENIPSINEPIIDVDSDSETIKESKARNKKKFTRQNILDMVIPFATALATNRSMDKYVKFSTGLASFVDYADIKNTISKYYSQFIANNILSTKEKSRLLNMFSLYMNKNYISGYDFSSRSIKIITPNNECLTAIAYNNFGMRVFYDSNGEQLLFDSYGYQIFEFVVNNIRYDFVDRNANRIFSYDIKKQIITDNNEVQIFFSYDDEGNQKFIDKKDNQVLSIGKEEEIVLDNLGNQVFFNFDNEGTQVFLDCEEKYMFSIFSDDNIY